GPGYGSPQGPSFASPHAAGAPALLMPRGLNNVQARQRILDTADSSSGAPRLDAARAIGAGPSCQPATSHHSLGKGSVPAAPPVGVARARAHASAPSDRAPAASAKPSASASVVVSGPEQTTPSSAPSALAPLRSGGRHAA